MRTTMRYAIPATFLAALLLGAAQAQARSCSSFVVIKGYHAPSQTVKVEHERGNVRKYFPKPEGAPTDTTKIPKTCGGRSKKDVLAVKSTGGRMTITQVRSNFEGKMLNDTSSEEWFASQMKELIENETEVVAVIRPGMKKDDPLTITTIYLPITDEELAEIKRLEEQAEDV